MREYAVIFGQTATGWSAHAPDLPGLVATGPTFEAVAQLMRDGLAFHLESMLADGDPIPPQSTRVAMLSVGQIAVGSEPLARIA